MKFNKKVLANGLTVLHEQRDVPVTTVMLAVKYGSAYETSDEKGIAHFIEHLCFKGTDKRNVRQIAETVEKVGGDLNAFTHEEITAYHVKLPSAHLCLAMDVIFDIFFNASFPKEEISKEANVICEEIKMYHDNPRSHVLDKIKESLYYPPFGDFIAGSEKTVRSFTRNELYSKHRAVYVPANSILCVVGNNDFEEVLNFAERFCVERKSIEFSVPKIEKRLLKVVERRENICQANLALGFHFPKLSEEEHYAAEIFSAILGQGMSSKLFSEVREKRGLVYGVKTEMDLGKNYGYMIISAGTDSNKVDEVIKISIKEFSKMGEITEDELAMAKIQVIGNQDVGSENSNEVAVDLILAEVSGDAKDYYNYSKKVNSVTLEDIKTLASKTEFASFSLVP